MLRFLNLTNHANFEIFTRVLFQRWCLTDMNKKLKYYKLASFTLCPCDFSYLNTRYMWASPAFLCNNSCVTPILCIPNLRFLWRMVLETRGWINCQQKTSIKCWIDGSLCYWSWQMHCADTRHSVYSSFNEGACGPWRLNHLWQAVFGV